MSTLTGVMLLFAVVTGTPAQEVVFEAQVPASNCTSLLVRDGLVVGGLAGGGLALWPQDDPDAVERVTAGRELSGNYVTDLAWTGAHVWVATAGGGLTRITDIAGQRQYRQFTSVLGGMDLTAVGGAIVGDSERVFYGIAGGGVGEIINGVGGAVYNAEQDGLLSDDVNALIVHEGVLFAGTDLGVSRFGQSVFTTYNDGLTSLGIRDFAVDGNGELLAAGTGGVFRWNPGSEDWTFIGSLGSWINDIATGNGELWALGVDAASNSVLGLWNGTSFDLVTVPPTHCFSLAMADELWIGGRWRDDTMAGNSYLAYVGRHDGDQTFTTWIMNSALFVSTEGLTFGADGRLWLGDWNGNAVSAFDTGAAAGQQWTSISQLATAENDSSGLFNYSGNVLCMTTGTDDAIWFNQFFSGLLRHDPTAGNVGLVHTGNSALPGRSVVNMIVHPDGTLIVMHDYNQAGLVEVVTDPVHWRNPSNWSALPEGSPGLGNGENVWDAVVERNDVIWFAVEGVGLVRWDINGSAGPNEALTWHDQGDDDWSTPVSNFPGSSNDPSDTKGLALAPDGTIWAGGNGLVRFSYATATDPVAVTVEESWGEKTGAFLDGLVNGNVKDVVVDANGDCWVATATGLNRVRTRGEITTIDAWLDVANYYGNPLYQLLYSPNVIAALPGITYRKLAVDATGRRVAVSADQGAALLTIGSSGGGQSDQAVTAYCYPNPLTPGPGDAQLKLGGIAADAAADDAATIEIYNLEGQLVFRDRYVTADEGFWDGNNRFGKPVATGVYVVKVSWRGGHTLHNLALVR